MYEVAEMPKPPVDHSRRRFLRACLAIPAGVAVGGMTALGIKDAINDEVTELTNHPAGNAGMDQEAKTACEGSKDMDQCVEDWDPPMFEKVSAVSFGPVMEEFLFRAIPSVIIDSRKYGFAADEPIDNLISGTGGFKFSKSEVVAGVTSTLLFGLVHNITNAGLDTRTIPASQMFGGLTYWGLQRKLGFMANTSAHITNNVSALFFLH